MKNSKRGQNELVGRIKEISESMRAFSAIMYRKILKNV